MNDSHGLTKENFLRSLPVSISGDQKMVALAEVIAGALERNREELEGLAVYPHIDRLGEGLLDILARDFKVDWWDGDYSLDEKRRTFATSWQVHKSLGTKGAVETALRAIYPNSAVLPWFEYGGNPYHFRLEIDLTEEQYSSGKPEMALRKVQYYKSLRDHMDEIQYTITIPAYLLYIGCIAGKNTALGVPPGADTFSFQDNLHIGPTAGMWSELPVPEDAATRPAPTVLRTGGVCTILSNLSIGE